MAKAAAALLFSIETLKKLRKSRKPEQNKSNLFPLKVKLLTSLKRMSS